MSTVAAQSWPCSIADYHADDSAIGHSMLEIYRESPRLYYRRHVAHSEPPQKATRSQVIGTYLHYAALEPEIWKRHRVIPVEIDRRTKAGKAHWEGFLAECQSENLFPIDSEDYAQVEEMRESLFAEPECRRLLELDGQREHSVRWSDQDHEWKARFDLWHDGLHVSLKTASDPSPDGFNKAVANFGYDRGQAHYHQSGLVERHLFVVVGNSVPFDAAVYELDRAWISYGTKEYVANRRNLLDAYAFDSWHGRTWGKVTQLSPPKWRLRDDD